MNAEKDIFFPHKFTLKSEKCSETGIKHKNSSEAEFSSDCLCVGFHVKIQLSVTKLAVTRT